MTILEAYKELRRALPNASNVMVSAYICDPAYKQTDPDGSYGVSVYVHHPKKHFSDHGKSLPLLVNAAIAYHQIAPPTTAEEVSAAATMAKGGGE